MQHELRLCTLHHADDSDSEGGSKEAIFKQLTKVAKAFTKSSKDDLTVIQSGFKTIQKSRWCEAPTATDSSAAWSDYKWYEHMSSQVNRCINARGATQTRELLANGKREEVMYKECFTNDGVKHFQDKIAKYLISITDPDVVPEGTRDAKGEIHVGLPTPPLATEKPNQGAVSIVKAASEMGVNLPPISVRDASDTYERMTRRTELMDRAVRVALNECFGNVHNIIEASDLDACECRSARCKSCKFEENKAIDAVEMTHEVIMEAVSQIKLMLNKELMITLGLKVNTTEQTEPDHPFDSALVRATDPKDKERFKSLTKHVKNGIAPVSKRPVPPPSTGQHQANERKRKAAAAKRALKVPRADTPATPPPRAARGARGGGRASRGGGRGGRGNARAARVVTVDQGSDNAQANDADDNPGNG